mmetsp:Transcript_53462/g.155877  ORF Transcript_53462/g.155877 Transcript_53462/m.155877 type:complete len:378 (+) Transcript_53462:154-1287(+)
MGKYNLIAAQLRILKNRMDRFTHWDFGESFDHEYAMAQLSSHSLHMDHCDLLRFPVHSPALAAHLVRDQIGDRAARHAKRIHKRAGALRHPSESSWQTPLWVPIRRPSPFVFDCDAPPFVPDACKDSPDMDSDEWQSLASESDHGFVGVDSPCCEYKRGEKDDHCHLEPSPSSTAPEHFGKKGSGSPVTDCLEPACGDWRALPSDQWAVIHRPFQIDHQCAPHYTLTRTKRYSFVKCRYRVCNQCWYGSPSLVDADCYYCGATPMQRAGPDAPKDNSDEVFYAVRDGILAKVRSEEGIAQMADACTTIINQMPPFVDVSRVQEFIHTLAETSLKKSLFLSVLEAPGFASVHHHVRHAIGELDSITQITKAHLADIMK